MGRRGKRYVLYPPWPPIFRECIAQTASTDYMHVTCFLFRLPCLCFVPVGLATCCPAPLQSGLPFVLVTGAAFPLAPPIPSVRKVSLWGLTGRLLHARLI